MTEISERYDRLSERFAAVVAAVPSSRWSALSPCEGWTARDVVRHVIDTQALFVALASRSASGTVTVDDDPIDAWEMARATLRAGLEDPATAGATFEDLTGPTRFDHAVDRFLSFDLVIHRWDLARATGLDERIPLLDVTRATELAAALGPMLQSTGGCGPPVHLRPAANAQTRLLALVGRRA